jgi:hypothetical protein
MTLSVPSPCAEFTSQSSNCTLGSAHSSALFPTSPPCIVLHLMSKKQVFHVFYPLDWLFTVGKNLIRSWWEPETLKYFKDERIKTRGLLMNLKWGVLWQNALQFPWHRYLVLVYLVFFTDLIKVKESSYFIILLQNYKKSSNMECVNIWC